MALLHLNKEAAWRSLGRWGWSSTEYPVEVWSPSWEQVTLRNLHPNWDKNLKKTNVWGQAVGNLADHAFQSSWIQSFKSWRGKKRKDVCLWLKTLMSLFSWLLMLEKVQRGWLCSWNPCSLGWWPPGVQRFWPHSAGWALTLIHFFNQPRVELACASYSLYDFGFKFLNLCAWVSSSVKWGSLLHVQWKADILKFECACFTKASFWVPALRDLDSAGLGWGPGICSVDADISPATLGDTQRPEQDLLHLFDLAPAINKKSHTLTPNRSMFTNKCSVLLYCVIYFVELGDTGGQRSLEGCSPWGCNESGMT